MDDLIGFECKVRIVEPNGFIIEKTLIVEALEYRFIKLSGVWVNKDVIVSIKL